MKLSAKHSANSCQSAVRIGVLFPYFLYPDEKIEGHQFDSLFCGFKKCWHWKSWS